MQPRAEAARRTASPAAGPPARPTAGRPGRRRPETARRAPAVRTGWRRRCRSVGPSVSPSFGRAGRPAGPVRSRTLPGRSPAGHPVAIADDVTATRGATGCDIGSRRCGRSRRAVTGGGALRGYRVTNGGSHFLGGPAKHRVHAAHAGQDRVATRSRRPAGPRDLAAATSTGPRQRRPPGRPSPPGRQLPRPAGRRGQTHRRPLDGHRAPARLDRPGGRPAGGDGARPASAASTRRRRAPRVRRGPAARRGRVVRSGQRRRQGHQRIRPTAARRGRGRTATHFGDRRDPHDAASGRTGGTSRPRSRRLVGDLRRLDRPALSPCERAPADRDFGLRWRARPADRRSVRPCGQSVGRRAGAGDVDGVRPPGRDGDADQQDPVAVGAVARHGARSSRESSTGRL